MRKFIMGGLGLAALCVTGLGVSAAPLSVDTNVKSAVTGANVEKVQFGGAYVGPGWIGPRYGYGYRDRYGYRDGWRYRRGIGPGVAGLAAGAIIGGAIAGAARPNYYYEDGVADGDNTVAYCMNRYKSYDPASGTFLGYDGLRHPCP